MFNGKIYFAQSIFLSCLIISTTSNVAFADMQAPLMAPEAPAVYNETKPNISLIAGVPIFTIQLKSTPSTGYSWFLSEFDSTMLTPVSHHYVPPAINGVAGASGYELWTFQAIPAAFLVPRLTTIRFSYIRPWAVNDAPTNVVFNISTKQHIS